MKKLGLALLALAVLLVVAVLVIPSFVDWNQHKGRITAEVEKLTGRTLVIEGDINLALLPAPALSADRVRVANIEGGSAPSMIELESLEVRIALTPLLQGQVQFESVSLVRPTILLEVLADGRRNWDFAGAQEPAPAPARRPDADDGLPGDVRLDSVTISGGTLIYRDIPGGREERVADLDAEIVAGSLKGPFAVSGSAVAHDLQTEFEVTLGRLVQGGATSLNIGLVLPEAGAKAQFGGAVSLHPDSTSLRGRIKAEGENLSSLMAVLAGGADAIAVLEQPFAIETELSADSQLVSVGDLTLRLGETSIDGDLRIKPGAPLDVRVNISASRLDLDKLLATQPGAAGGAGATPGQGGQAGDATAPEQAAFALPDDITGSMEITIDALIYRQQVVRQVLVSIALAKGRLDVNQALALLPGGSDLLLTGTLAPKQTAAGPDLRFDGRLEAASDNLRGIFEWLGVDVATMPAERLRRMSLSSRIAATAGQVTFGEIDLRVDVSRATGGIAVALRKRLGFGIGLAIDKLNLDAYLPPEGAARPEKKDAKATATQGAGSAEAPAAPAGALAALAGFDANLDLKVGSLSLRGVNARELHLDATLQQGAVTLREALVGDLAGSRVRLAGAIADLAATPTVDLEVELAVPDAARLAKLAGLETDAFSRIGAFELAGKVKGSLERIGFDGKIQALGGRLGLAGTAQPLAAPPGFDVTVAAKHSSLANLVRALDLGIEVGPKLGGLDLSAHVVGTAVKFQVADLAGALGPVALSGGFGTDLSGAGPVVGDLDLQVAVKHPDLAELVRALAPEVDLGKGLGGVDLKGRVTGTAMAFQVSELAGRLGKTDLSGAIGVDASGPKPAIDVELSTGELPLAALMAPAAGKGGQTGTGGGAAAAASGKTATGGRWSSEPIDVTALNEFNAQVKLASKALLLEDLRLDNASIEASLTDGILDLRKLSGTAYGGALAVTGKIDARKTLEAGLAVNVIELSLARLLHDLAESDRVAGPLNLNATLSTRGRSEAELVSALSGKGDLSGTIEVKTKKEEKVGSLLLGVLGQKVKEVRGVTDVTNLLFNAFADAPAGVRGTFTVERGVIRTNDLRADGRQAFALTQGTADLPAWQLDSQTGVYRADDPDNPYVTVDLRGPLDAPNPRVRGVAFQPRQQPAPAPAAGPQPSGPARSPPAPQPAPQPAPEQTDPEDIIRKNLEKTLKDLLGN